MKPIPTRTFTSHQLLRALVLVMFLSGVAYYILFQARLFLDGPTITLVYEPPTEQHTPTVTIEGVAENITSLSLNGKSIFTDENGWFEHPLVLEHGYTIMTLSAKDRYGHSVSLSRSFVYIPDSNTTIN